LPAPAQVRIRGVRLIRETGASRSAGGK
jgi:hypothetical protein